ncbi:hypothetical protein AC1031_010218 [Aphanomyces cochlioides]|nr:hypothetical protein AC1031_010218 [Aphanomyces cochlioides]
MWKNLAYNTKTVVEAKPDGFPMAPMVSEVAPKDVPETVVGRLQKILEFLNSIPGHKAVSVAQIYQKTGIDLSSPGEYEVSERVRNNTKVRTEGELFAYKAKFDIKNRDDLLRQLNRCPEGIPSRDIKDCYATVEDDLRHLTRIGTVICIRNTEDGNDVYFPRGELFLSELSGVAVVELGSYIAATKEDITTEIRRGDAVKVGDHWFRVSAAPKAGGSSQPPIFMAGMTTSKSVSSVRDLNVDDTKKKPRYMLNFDSGHLPLDTAYPDARGNIMMHQKWDTAPKMGRGPPVKMLKHGCTNDVRQLWRDTLTGWPSDRVALERAMLHCGLMTRDMHEASMNRSKMRKVGKGNKKVPRQRKQRDIKITNTHLVGTALGEALAKGGTDGFTLGAVKFEKQ